MKGKPWEKKSICVTISGAICSGKSHLAQEMKAALLKCAGKRGVRIYDDLPPSWLDSPRETYVLKRSENKHFINVFVTHKDNE